MKTFLHLLAIALISTISARADLSASRGGGGHHGSFGGHPSGRVFFGHHHGFGGPWFYGGWGYPYWDYGYYQGYYGYYPYPSGSAASGGGQAYSPSGPSYDELGKFWGKRLKSGERSPAQLETFLRSEIVSAPTASQDLFRGGFLKSYKGGGPVLDQAMHQAEGTSAPK
jgi:hypothetical protein